MNDPQSFQKSKIGGEFGKMCAYDPMSPSSATPAPNPFSPSEYDIEELHTIFGLNNFGLRNLDGDLPLIGSSDGLECGYLCTR